MPDYAKIFTYQVDGLSYTVSLYEENGTILADIAVTEGSMDVNAVYFGDDDFSGKSASLGGPLNMNGASLDGEKVQWDEAIELSRPGIGPMGDDKETYLHQGDTLTIDLGVDSLDDIDTFGIRATSTSTDAGSIKAVSSDPEEPEEPEDPEEPTYEKVFFGWDFKDDDSPLSGRWILDQAPDPNPYQADGLPEGTEPTFENYLDYYASDPVWGDVDLLQGVVFYEHDENGALQELFRFEAPEDGFQSKEEVMDAYHDALDAYEAEQETAGTDLLAALSLDLDETTETEVEDQSEEEDYDYA
ncbi:hypothetical protein [Arenibacterium sp. LLYu02]|uniref:hypothetical protein n=1 Tax=Arenibacterium sp. LLYu02 TaxID=3404132 RepID=UPI003B2185A9